MNESNPNPNLWESCDPDSDGHPAARDCWSNGCGSDGSFSDETCVSGNPVYQHGPGEGLSDVVEACAMDAVGSENFLLWWPFVYCFEGNKLSNAYPGYSFGTPKDPALFESTLNATGYSFDAAINLTMTSAQECATLVGLNWTHISKCADPSVGADGQLQVGKLGDRLEEENALVTVKLNPPHSYTPWVVFQGSPVNLDNNTVAEGFLDGDSLLNWICAAYEGELPDGCPSDPFPFPG